MRQWYKWEYGRIWDGVPFSGWHSRPLQTWPIGPFWSYLFFAKTELWEPKEIHGPGLALSTKSPVWVWKFVIFGIFRVWFSGTTWVSYWIQQQHLLLERDPRICFSCPQRILIDTCNLGHKIEFHTIHFNQISSLHFPHGTLAKTHTYTHKPA